MSNDSSEHNPYQQLIDEAVKAADLLDATSGCFDQACKLRAAATGLAEQLRDRVNNKGGRIELHRFPDRSLTDLEQLYLTKARDHARDGELEFDDDTVISGCDDGAYVLGWFWVSYKDTK